MFERLDLTVSIEMDHEGKVLNCSKNVYDVFGHKRKYATATLIAPWLHVPGT